MKRSISILALALVSTLAVAQTQQTQSNSTNQVTLGGEVKPELTTNGSRSANTINPALDKIVDDGEFPNIMLDQPDLALEENLSLEVYPNPSSGFVTVQLPQTEDRIVSIELIDFAGKIRYSDLLYMLDEQLRKEMDFSSLEAGTYILRVVYETNVLMKKIVKTN